MFSLTQRISFITGIIVLLFSQVGAQKLLPFKLPDTGQSTSYISTPGEDADFIINPMSFTDNRNGTITDNNTGLMWQKTDGGETTIENATIYCTNLTLGGFADWRLPTSIELFSINNYDHLNPALDTLFFTKTQAQYWWTNEKRADDSTRVWVVNSGGGIGPHPKTETVSAGGTKLFHVRAVRNPFSTTFSVSHFTDNADGTIKDNYTGLTWQKIQSPDTMTWEQGLVYSKSVSLAGKTDWRLPSVKELQSLNDETLLMPSFNKHYFPNVLSGNYWSSTTMYLTPSIAWDINVDYGIVSYNDKTAKQNVLLVRGGMDNKDLNIVEVLIPGGNFDMGDHYGFGDPSHPSDELPIHTVKIDSLFMTRTDITNQQYLAFLNSSLLQGSIEVRSNIVYAVGDTNIYCYTHQYASSYSISYDGKVFYITDFRANHPVVGIMWYGILAYCNWLSLQNGLQECYTLKTQSCDFTKTGYRLPTEAEWEYSARGGQKNPYYNYPWGNDLDITKANWPDSKDPYESLDSTTYPWTTPVVFYNGALHLKSEYNWPGSVTSYQTSNGANAFGLYDMAGNVWQAVNDWYETNYYSVSPYDNPKGPVLDSASLMPDGKRYRGMRGGNWYNGDIINSVNDGHSRVSNRDPAYYRGPIAEKDSWSEVGFRVTRKYIGTATGINESGENHPDGFRLYQNYPNPFNPTTVIRYQLSAVGLITLKLYDVLGREVAVLVNEVKPPGGYSVTLDATRFSSGIYFYKIQAGSYTTTKKMVLTK
ncbi:MAG: DUF1566 domain-containing protein [Bacteroidota bacterium]